MKINFRLLTTCCQIILLFFFFHCTIRLGYTKLPQKKEDLTFFNSQEKKICLIDKLEIKIKMNHEKYLIPVDDNLNQYLKRKFPKEKIETIFYDGYNAREWFFYSQKLIKFSEVMGVENEKKLIPVLKEKNFTILKCLEIEILVDDKPSDPFLATFYTTYSQLKQLYKEDRESFYEENHSYKKVLDKNIQFELNKHCEVLPNSIKYLTDKSIDYYSDFYGGRKCDAYLKDFFSLKNILDIFTQNIYNHRGELEILTFNHSLNPENAMAIHFDSTENSKPIKINESSKLENILYWITLGIYPKYTKSVQKLKLFQTSKKENIEIIYYKVEAKSSLFFFIPDLKESELKDRITNEILKKINKNSSSKN